MPFHLAEDAAVMRIAFHQLIKPEARWTVAAEAYTCDALSVRNIGRVNKHTKNVKKNSGIKSRASYMTGRSQSSKKR
jgi:hypothetical protein